MLLFTLHIELHDPIRSSCRRRQKASSYCVFVLVMTYDLSCDIIYRTDHDRTSFQQAKTISASRSTPCLMSSESRAVLFTHDTYAFMQTDVQGSLNNLKPQNAKCTCIYMYVDMHNATLSLISKNLRVFRTSVQNLLHGLMFTVKLFR